MRGWRRCGGERHHGGTRGFVNVAVRLSVVSFCLLTAKRSAAMGAAAQSANSEFVTEIAVYLVATCSLLLIAVNIQKTAVWGTVFGFILCSPGAYLVGVAI